MYFSQYFGFPNFLLVLESPDFKISKSFRHFCVTRATRLFGDFGFLTVIFTCRCFKLS